MTLRGAALVLIASTCFGQTTRPATDFNSPDDSAAMNAPANRGDADGQVKLADASLRGGAAQNNAEAVRLFRAAADKGNAGAQ